MNKDNEILSVDYDSYNEHVYRDIFDVQFGRASNPQLSGYGFTSSFLRIVFVLVSRLGFLLVQLGTIPVENVYRIIFYNVFEIANATATYMLLGYMFSFGPICVAGLISYSNDLKYNWDQVVVGLSAVLIGTAQISCFLVGRVHLISSTLVTFLYAALFQPLLMHWIWNDCGWMKRSVLLTKRVSVKDHGGDLVIHLSSSLFGVLGAITLGRRLIRVRDIDEHSVGHEHAASTIIGYIFVIFGYMAFSLPSPMYQSLRSPDNYIGIVVMNNMIALAAGIIMVSILHLLVYRKIFTYWIMLRCIQGGIAGIISVAAGVDIYNSLIAFAIAAVSSVFYFFFSILIHNTAVEDYGNFTASHLVCSFLGIMACPMLSGKENLATNRKYHVLWQFTCLLAVTVFIIILGWLLFIVLSLTGLLRTKRETMNHQRAMNVERHLPERSFLERLFMIDDRTEHIVPSEKSRKKLEEDEGDERRASKG